MNDKTLMWLCGIVAIILAAFYLNWINANDKAREQSAEAYENCVMAEYGTTPSAWYNEHGEYPYCDAKPWLK